jgi:hypothetical protein
MFQLTAEELIKLCLEPPGFLMSIVYLARQRNFENMVL